MRKIGFGIDFDKDKFLWEFCKASIGKKIKPQDDWFYLVELEAENKGISVEKVLVSYFLDGVKYRVEKYEKEIDEGL